MTMPLSPDEWENISAYMDGQLTGPEELRLEGQMRTRPELRRAMAELKRTSGMMHMVPSRRVPRNFTLKPEMVRQRKSWLSLIPSFGWASAIATVLLILTFVVQLLPNYQQFASPAAQQQIAMEVTRQMAERNATAESQPQAANPPIVVWQPPTGMGGGDGNPSGVPPGAGGMGGGPGGVPVTTAPDLTPSIQATEPPKLAAPLPTPTVEQTRPAMAEKSSPPLILGVRPTEEQGKVTSDNSAATPAPGQPKPVPSTGGLNLGGLQIGLLLVALGAGLSAFLLRRRS